MHKGGRQVGDERHDTAIRISRRAAFGAIGAAAAAVAAACGDSPTSATAVDTSSSSGTTSTNATCAVTPTETIGPYPSRTDMLRSDVRENRQGTTLTLTIKVVNAASACAPLAGADVEIWQCDAAGDYSQYGSQTAATFLRGIQTTNASGEVTFTTIYPGWYQGRATHIHVEVTMGGRSIKVTQIAFPESVSNVVHAQGVYASRGTNPTSNQSDGIFSDSLASELVTPVGSPSSGYTATFQVGVSL
jgi:protocatechuate 3,4-dioxygenase beta subunit